MPQRNDLDHHLQKTLLIHKFNKSFDIVIYKTLIILNEGQRVTYLSSSKDNHQANRAFHQQYIHCPLPAGTRRNF